MVWGASPFFKGNTRQVGGGWRPSTVSALEVPLFSIAHDAPTGLPQMAPPKDSKTPRTGGGL